MSIHNAIGEGSLNELLARRLNTPGGATAPGVAPELFPNITLENDRPEWGYLKQEQLGSVSRSVAGVAAEHFQFWMSNPFPPNLCTITAIECIDSPQLVIGIGPYPGFTIGSVIGNGANRDTRFQVANQVVFESGTAAVVPPTPRLVGRIQAVGQYASYREPIVLRPDNNLGLIIYSAAVNQTCRVNVHYRIRGAQPGELR